MAKQDRHPTIEQLSAYLDGQLSSGELSECDTHVETCQQCQQMLAELRETVALLHALPQPTLPRSFTLPPISLSPVSHLRSLFLQHRSMPLHVVGYGLPMSRVWYEQSVLSLLSLALSSFCRASLELSQLGVEP